MEMKIVNNHVLVGVETDLGLKTCVVDTGSPVTFFYDNVSEYKLGETSFGASPLGGIMRMAVPQQDEIEGLIGTEIHGFIGTDIMQECGDVLLDFINREILFGEVAANLEHSVPMTTLMGLPKFNVSFNGHETMAAFDTGAMFPFVSQKLSNEIGLPSPHRTFTDYHPGHGSFGAELHSCNICIDSVELGIRDIATAPYYDSILGLLGVSAFIGINALLDSTVLISYSRSKLFIAKSV